METSNGRLSVPKLEAQISALEQLLEVYEHSVLQQSEKLYKTQEKLEEAKNYIDNIVKSMADALIVINPDETIRTLNEAVMRLLGYKEQELIGKPVQKIFGDKNLFKAIDYKKWTQGNGLKNYRTSYLDKAGAKIPVLMSSSVFFDKRGKVAGVVILAHDIRELERLQEQERSLREIAAAAEKERIEALENVAEQLEERVFERTRELEKAQEQLIRSERMAAVGQLAASVGHELRNPLAAIHNAVYYLKDSLQGSSVLKQDLSLQEFLSLIENEIKNATCIISDLLDFSKIFKLEMRPTDVNGLLKEIQKRIQFPNTIKWVEEFAPNLPRTNLDPQRMQQVFTNLAVNAIQAMPKGGELRIITRVEFNSKIESSPFIAIDFKDTGVGIEKENCSKIFEPLFTTKAKGTGLGLAVSLSIAEKHGGKIAVASDIGKGSTFTVKIPLRRF